MVRQGDFEITLVDADTKEPFKEHYKDGKIYVEVEPDEEYFICLQRVGNALHKTLMACVSVDGKSLGYHNWFQPEFSEPCHAGLWTCKDGIATQTALVFTSPQLTQEGESKKEEPASGFVMGKVEVEIYNGIFGGYTDNSSFHSTFQSTWETSTIDQAMAFGYKEKKCVRSGEGTTSFIRQQSSGGQVASYTYGAKIDIFRLNYCTALGLILVGVLPKPPLWDYYRMLQTLNGNSSPTPASTPTRTLVPTISPIRIVSPLTGRVDELYDLTNLEDE